MTTFICTVEMDKTAGVKVTVANAEGTLTQTIKADGATIVITMTKDGTTSTYTQDESSVKIECKRFEVDASETITLKSQKDTTVTSAQKISLSADSDLTETSKSKVSLSAPTVEAKADTAATVKGAASELSLQGSGATLSTPATLSLTSKAQGTLDAPLVTVSAKASLSLESSALASINGKLVTVQGNLVTIG